MHLLPKLGLPVVLFLALLELLRAMYLREKKHDAKDTIANLVIGIIGTALGVSLWTGLAYMVYETLYQYSLFKIDMSSPLAWILAVLLADFVWYVEHRVGHETRLGWAVHSVHHSSEQFNIIVSVRLPWLGPLMRMFFLSPLALLGLSPVAILSGYAVVLIYQIGLHTEYVGKLGWIDRIFNTPSNHRAHHGKNKVYHDINYGGILIIWDRIFGTYRPEDEKVNYGITEPVNTYNPFLINLKPLADLSRDIWNAGSWKARILLPFARPGTHNTDKTKL